MLVMIAVSTAALLVVAGGILYFQRLTLEVGFVIIAALIAAGALAALLQRIIFTRVSALTETAQKVVLEKNFSVRTQVGGSDELGRLAESFNAVLDRIQQRESELQEINNSLEEGVLERTRNLSKEILERQRAQTALLEQVTRISLLNQITHAISERQDTESILHVVLRQLEDHLHLDLGSVALFDPAAETLNVAAVRLKNPLLAAKLDWAERVVVPLRETGLEPCLLGQTVSVVDTLKAPAVLAEKLAGAGLRSAVTVPLMVDGKLFGVLLAARLKPNDFSSADAEFLRMLSEHVALAAHQAQLHSELERAYNELRQTQHAVMQQERLKALGQMASGIAHDINNALSPVVGFADLLMQAEPSMSPNGKKYLQHIKTAGEDIGHIVARLREFYRRRDERQSLQELSLNQLAEQVIDMTRPSWRDIPQANGITIEVATELAPELPTLAGIQSELREALTNLVLNAVDALPHGGKITVRTRAAGREVSSNPAKYPSYVILEVADNGVGMNEETRRRCLEPFFSTKGKRGTGLGLAMVYGVTERHEGRIEVASTLGQGTTFSLFFPVRKLIQPGTESADPGANRRPLSILCIDDEPLLRELLKELLEREGHKVQVCDSGQAGIEAFQLARANGAPFDLVITDLGMPYVDGRQVARTLKRESPETPIVMLTGWGTIMKEEDALPEQVDGVLSKPPRSRELREILNRLTVHLAQKS